MVAGTTDRTTPNVAEKLSSQHLQDGNLRQRKMNAEADVDADAPLKVTDRLLKYRKIGVANIEPPLSLLYKDMGDGVKKERKIVGINGSWYDVTDFTDKHPGGPIIEKFIGKDATDVFIAYRHVDISKMRKPIGTYEFPVRHPADAEFRELIRLFEKKGYFTTDWVFYVRKLIVALCLLFFGIHCTINFDSVFIHHIGAASIALMIQQAGFIMHEAMHRQLFRDNWWADRILGLFVGTFLLGVSAHWWQDEHVLHHALTNVVDVEDRWVDPQMWEVTWAQHPKLFPLFQTALSWIFIKIQHITFIPLVVGVGRIEILTDAYRTEKRWYEWVAIILHWVWMIWLLSHLSTWTEVITWYFTLMCVEGIFHFQLILSHYAREHLHLSEYHEASWFAAMAQSNMNVDCPWWLDWFYGGLNFHIEHHLFPKMGRRHLREVGEQYIEPLCKKYGIEYLSLPFSSCMWYTLKRLKEVGTQFKLEIR